MTQEIRPTDSQFETDFSLEDEYKPDPLAPAGTYYGHVIQVAFDPEGQCIVWTIVLSGNNGVMSDGATPIDGQRFEFRNWLPRPGDESIMTPRGRSTKRQAKINMLKQFADGMKIKMNSKDDIVQGITEGLWLGIPVIARIAIETYQGRVINNVVSMVRNQDADIVQVDNYDNIPF